MTTAPKIANAPEHEPSAPGAKGKTATQSVEAESKPSPRVGHRPRGYRATLPVLYHARLSINAKRIYAATCAHPQMNPSYAQLEARTTLKNGEIAEAQRELESEGIFTYRRPLRRIDGTPQFTDSNKATTTSDDFNPHLPQNDRITVFLTPEYADRLPRLPLAPLVALHYARQHRIAGAISEEDNSVAALFRIAPERVRRVREQMLKVGLLEHHHRDGYRNVYVSHGATPGVEPDPEHFDLARTYRLTTVETPWPQIPTIELRATERQTAKLEHRTAQLGQLRTFLALEMLYTKASRAAYPDDSEFDDFDYDPDEIIIGEPVDYDEIDWPTLLPIDGGDLIDALKHVEQNPPEIVLIRDSEGRWVDPKTTRDVRIPPPIADVFPRDIESGVQPLEESLTSSAREAAPFDVETDPRSPSGDTDERPTPGEARSGWEESEPPPSAAHGGTGALLGPREKTATKHWPAGVAERAVELFGVRAARPGRDTYDTINREIRFALRVWGERYGLDGELTADQRGFAAERILDALDFLADKPLPTRYALIEKSAIRRLVNDEETDAGFKELPPPSPPQRDDLVDVHDLLAGLVD